MKNILIFLLVIILFGCDNSTEKVKLNTQINSLTAKNDSLELHINQLQSKIDSINNESNFWFDDSVEGNQFLEMGIKNPREYIIKSLTQKPELIPIKSILGGQMKFMQVKLLGKECLIAYFEDGHTSGRAIYSYEFTNGKLDFKIIKSCQD